MGQLEEKLGIKPGEDERVVDQEKAQVAESKEQKPAKESLEERIGGTWLNRLGIIALLVGLRLAFAELGYAYTAWTITMAVYIFILVAIGL